MLTILDKDIQPADLLPTEQERELAKAGRRVLEEFVPAQPVSRLKLLEDGHEREIQLPRQALRLLGEVLREMGRGNAVAVIPVESEITTQQAADILNVSRPYLVGLLEGHEIPFRKIGAHRRVKLLDVLRYKRRVDAERVKVLEELAAQAQELNMGY
jgi:excisionase family DNA binding protein